MQQMRETIRLFAGQLSERSGLSASISARVNLQRLPNSNAKAGNTNIVLLINSCVYFSNSTGTIR